MKTETGAPSAGMCRGSAVLVAVVAGLVAASAAWAAPPVRDGTGRLPTLDDFSSTKARSGRAQSIPGSRTAMYQEALRRLQARREAEAQSRPRRHGEQPRITDDERRALWGRDRRQPEGGCRASGAIAPCAALGVASLEKKQGPDVAEGNPVNPLTGRKYQVELDAAPADGVLGLEIRRHYSSGLGGVANPVGRGWMLSYDTHLYVVGNSLQIIQADGHRLIFHRPSPAADRGAGSVAGDGMSSPALGAFRPQWRPDWLAPSSHPVCISPAGDTHLLRSILATRQATAPSCTGQAREDGEVLLLASGYRWRWPSGRELDFDAAGFLVEIREPKAGEDDRWHVLRIRRNRHGHITQVTDPAGRTMHLHHDARGHLSAIDHPRGRWLYRVSASGQLLSVQSPSRARRLYRYEDPGFPSALSAIEMQAPGSERLLRVGSWRYDTDGRVSDYHGPRGDLHFSYLPEDEHGVAGTVVTDADGNSRTWRHRQQHGQWQVLSVTGGDCRQCALGDRYFRYDEQGRLAGIRDQVDLPNLSLSRMYRFVHDAQGRIAQVHRRHWRRSPSGGHTPPAEGEDELTLFRRYEYADAGSRLPRLVARPSVEPGREYTVQFEYALAGGRLQPVRITESGYSHGELQQRSVQITHDEQGRIRRIDGPLPGDDDRVDFLPFTDEHGTTRYRLVDGLGREILPAARGAWLVESLRWLQDNGRFDVRAGAIRHVAGNGAEQQVVVDDFGRITQTTSPDAGVERVWYDLADRVVRQTDAAGADVRIDHDAFGRPLLRRLTGPGGFVEETRYRYEGTQLVEVRHPVATERYRYDDQGRLLERRAVVHPVAGGAGQTFVTRYRHRPGQPLPVEVVLPNGAVIRQSVDARWHTVSMAAGGAVGPLSEHAQRRLASVDHVSASGTGGLSLAGPDTVLYRREIHGHRLSDGLREEQWLFGNGSRRRLWWAPGGRLLGVMDDRLPRDTTAAAPSLAAPSSPLTRTSARATAHQPSGEGAVLSAEILDHDADGRIRTILAPDRLQRLAYSKAGYLLIAEDHPWSPAFKVANHLPDDGRLRTPAGRRAAHSDSSRGGGGPSDGRDPAGRTALSPEAAAWWYAYDGNGNRLFSGRHHPQSGQAAVGREPSPTVSSTGTRVETGASTGPGHGMGGGGADTGRATGAGNSINGRPSGNDTGSSHGNGVDRGGSVDGVGDVSGVSATYEKGSNRQQGVPHDPAGRPLQWQGWQIGWHPGGQIAWMRHRDGRALRYFYNHRGERVARQENGRWSFFDHHDGRLQAEWRDDRPGMRTWWYEGEIPVMVIEDVSDAGSSSGWMRRWTRWLGMTGEPRYRLSWLHVGHHGLPQAMSDGQGRVVWRQRFGPFGEMVAAPDGAVDAGHAVPATRDPLLRFPGQWVDTATGLYYNLMRDYDPVTGRYLSPDPLGLRAGPNPYLYVNGDPVRNIDPAGLLLFAFDGTANAPDQQTNVWKFALLYDQDNNGAAASAAHRQYLSGVGVMGGAHTAYDRDKPFERSKLESAIADTWRDNIEYHVQQFRAAVHALTPGETLNVDVVGFSRGAAQALEFGRLIARELKSGSLANASQVNLRFMGLLDPVATNMFDLGSPPSQRASRVYRDGWSTDEKDYDWTQACKPMTVDDEWQSVVNILSTEDRRDLTFSAGSLGRQVVNHPSGVKREEFALIGAHSDIGGGYESGPDSDGGDLSDVALWALLERARDAGIRFGPDMPEAWKTVSRPFVHFEQWVSDLTKDQRHVLVDGEWVRSRESAIPGTDVTHADAGWSDITRNRAGVGILQELGKQRLLAGALFPVELNLPQTEGERDMQILAAYRSLSTVGHAQVDMQKYCAYLLTRGFLQKCPY